MPLATAIKLPVFIYGSVKFYSLAGNVEFDNMPIRRGMVKLGQNSDVFFANPRPALILLSSGSKIIFKGPCSFSIGYTLRISNGGTLQIGEYIGCGSGVKIFCEDFISIGAYCRIAFDCQVLDTNFHYILDAKTNLVHRNTKPVKLGAFNWIGNRTAVMKGTETKDHTIVSTGSLLNKNYIKSIDCDDIVLLAGTPAKLITHGNKRIFSLRKETEIRNFFKNTNADSFIWTDDMVDDYSDMINLF